MTPRRGPRLAAALLLSLLCGCDLADLVQSDGNVRFAAITAGSAHTCALDQAGAIWCWGANDRGQLGIGGSGGTEDQPTAITGGHQFRTVAAGGLTTCAIDTAGAIWCWGANESGQLGDGTRDDADHPIAVRTAGRYSSVAVGGSHACASTDAGVVLCWGANLHGQLGAGTGEFALVPVAVQGAPSASVLAAGVEQSCAIGTTGTFCWGGNGSLQLGGGTRNSSAVPVRVGTSVPAIRLASGTAHVCALRVDHRIECWGAADVGQVGNGPGEPEGVPRRPSLPDDATFVAVGAGGDASCAATVAEVWCWGEDTTSRLGRIATVPHRITGIVDPVGDLAVGDHHACAIVGSSFYCWGDDSSGQLGQG